MGGSSSSQSSSSTTQTTENYDQRVAVESEGVGVGAGAQVNLTLTDQGVVAGAAEFLNRTLDFSDAAVSGIVDGFTQITQDALATTREASEDDAKELASLVVKVGAFLAGAIALFALASKGNK